jgi:hypothetical protein
MSHIAIYKISTRNVEVPERQNKQLLSELYPVLVSPFLSLCLSIYELNPNGMYICRFRKIKVFIHLQQFKVSHTPR